MRLAVPTPKQKRILDFIEAFHRKTGTMPSRREIAEGLGLSSVATVQQHIDALEGLGLLERTERSSRALGLPEALRAVAAGLNLPLLGRVAAGYPIEVFEQKDEIEVPSSMITRGPHFALQVTGDSMVDDGILDGDIVVIRKQARALNGETVVALVENEATIKRFYQRDGFVELIPANPRFKPIRVSGETAFQIEGVLSGVLRHYGRRAG